MATLIVPLAIAGTLGLAGLAPQPPDSFTLMDPASGLQLSITVADPGWAQAAEDLLAGMLPEQVLERICLEADNIEVHPENP